MFVVCLSILSWRITLHECHCNTCALLCFQGTSTGSAGYQDAGGRRLQCQGHQRPWRTGGARPLPDLLRDHPAQHRVLSHWENTPHQRWGTTNPLRDYLPNTGYSVTEKIPRIRCEEPLIHCEITLPNTGYSVTEEISHIRCEGPLIHCEFTLPNTGYSVTEEISHNRGEGPLIHCEFTMPNTISFAEKMHHMSMFFQTPHSFSRYFLGHVKDALRKSQWFYPDRIYSCWQAFPDNSLICQHKLGQYQTI